ncbi:hypothetical protein R1flu_011311 [Riccia fluitans]|uniref:Uncharacterized protein n=1 Tax=Riccia fluitans TaxID=41844 RepID=A0ABD1Z7G5_9MARC
MDKAHTIRAKMQIDTALQLYDITHIPNPFEWLPASDSSSNLKRTKLRPMHTLFTGVWLQNLEGEMLRSLPSVQDLPRVYAESYFGPGTIRIILAYIHIASTVDEMTLLVFEMRTMSGQRKREEGHTEELPMF